MPKQIMIGTEFFEDFIRNDFFYIDKTLFVKDFLENRGTVTLITRPRRFGKTLNMDMMRCFFDVAADNRHLFEGLQIMEHGDIIERHMNKYPVISLTLKNIEGRTYASALEDFTGFIAQLFTQHSYLLEANSLNEDEYNQFRRYRARLATESELRQSLLFLAECLYNHHNKKAIVLIDEYDAPINNAMLKGYYDEMIDFMRGFMGEVFKTNPFLEFGVLTGVQNVINVDFGSSLNHLETCMIFDKEFSSSFGFTDEEVRNACKKHGYTELPDDVMKWYGGYRFHDRNMYNPWSILNFLSKGVFENYWINSGEIAQIGDIIRKASVTLHDKLVDLLAGVPIRVEYDDNIELPLLYKSSDTFLSWMLNAGYLKPCANSWASPFYAELVNKEVRNILSNCIVC